MGKNQLTAEKNPFILDISELRSSSQESLNYHYEGPAPFLDQDLFPNKIVLDVAVICGGGEFWIEGEVATEAKLECSRCTEDFAMLLRATFKEEVFPGEGEGLGPNSVDIEPMVRDNLVLAIPMQPICREDCPGLCPRCGGLQGTCDCQPGPVDSRWQALLDLTQGIH